MWQFKFKPWDDYNKGNLKVSPPEDEQQVFCRVKRGVQSSPSPALLFLHSSSHWAPWSPQITCKCNLCSQVGHIGCPPTSSGYLHVKIALLHPWEGGGRRCERRLLEVVELWRSGMYPKYIHIHRFVLEGLRDATSHRVQKTSAYAHQFDVYTIQ